MILSDHILSLVTFLPLAGAFILMFVPGDDRGKEIARWVALIFSTLTFAVSLWMWAGFDNGQSGFQFVENYEWIGSSIGYRMGVDGISVLFVVLTALLTPICVISSWKPIQNRVREFMIVFLILDTLCIGVFTALDLAMFYVFFEGSLIPMFLIIGIWGGKRRIQASYKFFFYTFTGSVLMLLAIMAMYWQAGTLDIRKLLAFHFDPAV
ncbi:MAG TPA: proton-conducting transporter membrane subunit, partial [Devosia sp.]|nr:proton-conducting transporter membrane subunit [Devosia sp.]